VIFPIGTVCYQRLSCSVLCECCFSIPNMYSRTMEGCRQYICSATEFPIQMTCPNRPPPRHHRPRSLLLVRHRNERPSSRDADVPQERVRTTLTTEFSCPRGFRGNGLVGRTPDGRGLRRVRHSGTRLATLQALGLLDGASNSKHQHWRRHDTCRGRARLAHAGRVADWRRTGLCIW